MGTYNTCEINGKGYSYQHDCNYEDSLVIFNKAHFPDMTNIVLRVDFLRHVIIYDPFYDVVELVMLIRLFGVIYDFDFNEYTFKESSISSLLRKLNKGENN